MQPVLLAEIIGAAMVLETASYGGSDGLCAPGARGPHFLGRHRLASPPPGALMSIYLLAQRVFWSFDALVDLRLDVHRMRGPVAHCFERQPFASASASSRCSRRR